MGCSCSSQEPLITKDRFIEKLNTHIRDFKDDDIDFKTDDTRKDYLNMKFKAMDKKIKMKSSQKVGWTSNKY